MEAIRIIQAEHLALAAVLHGMLHIIRRIRFGSDAPDFEVLEAMVSYAVLFPERVHHPKEEQYLFKVLRNRNPAASSLIERLVAEHAAGAAKVKELQEALRRYREGGERYFARFAGAATAYAASHWDHAKAEEYEIIPSAENFLTPSDWAWIDQQFLANEDPLIKGDTVLHCDALFRRIVSVVPPPVGVARSVRTR